MAKSEQEILTEIAVIGNETEKSANTNERVANTLLDMFEYSSETDAKVEGAVSAYLGDIPHSAIAPTPGKSGWYKFSTSGVVSWLSGTPTVSVGDQLSVVYANSEYTYTLIDTSYLLSDEVGSDSSSSSASSKAVSKAASVLNLDVLFPLSTGYYDKATAKNVVPTYLRKRLTTIMYTMLDGETQKFITEQFIGADSSVWSNQTYWRDIATSEDIASVRSDLSETTDKLTELGAIVGVYEGSYSNQQIFSKDEVQGGTKIKLFITPKNTSFNALIYDIDGTVIERFQSTTATIGQTYYFEYTLPNNYDYLKIGGYGEVFLKVVCDTRNLPLIDASVKSNTTILAQHSTSISNLETRTIVDKGQELQIISPITILENKQLIINTGVGVVSDSSLQNIAEFDVTGLAEIAITANVSTNEIVGYAFVYNDNSPISVGSESESGGSVVEHIISVPDGAEKIRFPYFKEGGISAKALMNVIVPVNEFAKDVLKVAEIANSLVGRDAMSATTATLTNGTLTIADVPIYTKKDCVLSFSAKVTSFSSVEFGLGYGGVRGLHIIIDGTDVTYRTANSQRFKESHNLNIGTFLRCSVFHELKKYVIVISTINGTYFKEFNESQLYYAETYGAPYIYANSGTTLTDVKLSNGGADFKKPVWIFGDSYTSFDVKRWVYHIIDYGFTNFMLCGLAGAVSSQMFEQLQYCLKFGTPKYIVWCLGMNDGAGEIPYRTYYEKVKELCDKKGIELVLQTIPSTPTTNKSAINSIIRNSGCRYVDVYSAVGSNDSGVWYTGYNDDGTHPTELGAKAIASQFLADFPELMQY